MITIIIYGITIIIIILTTVNWPSAKSFEVGKTDGRRDTMTTLPASLGNNEWTQLELVERFFFAANIIIIIINILSLM